MRPLASLKPNHHQRFILLGVAGKQVKVIQTQLRIVLW
jgi:hypothetical protein